MSLGVLAAAPDGRGFAIRAALSLGLSLWSLRYVYRLLSGGLGQMLNKINSISKSKIDDIAEEVLDDFERVGGKKVIDELKDWGDEFF